MTAPSATVSSALTGSTRVTPVFTFRAITSTWSPSFMGRSI